MHEHDQELIMALAEGSLGDDAAASARTQIAACPECSADLELQVTALAMLDEIPQEYLTAAESARLHSELKRELNLATPPPAAARRSFAWPRLLPAAGLAAALLVVIIAVPTLFAGGASDEAADETMAAPAFEDGATDTTEAASMAIERDGAGDMAGSADALVEAAPEESGLAETTTTSAVTAAGDSGALLDALEFLGPVEDLNASELLERIRGNVPGAVGYSDEAKAIDPIFALCLEESVTGEVARELGIPAESDAVVVGTVTNAAGEELILVAYIPADIEETVFTVHRLPCPDIALVP